MLAHDPKNFLSESPSLLEVGRSDRQRESQSGVVAEEM